MRFWYVVMWMLGVFLLIGVWKDEDCMFMFKVRLRICIMMKVKMIIFDSIIVWVF